MGTNTEISWTDATWNPVTGCSHLSDGCRNCFAEALSLRFGFSKKPWTAPNAAENVVLHPERLDQPLRWQKPRRVFVNSMSDLFHERIPDTFIAAVFGVMAASPRHTFQVLTKRPERMLQWFNQVERWAAQAKEVFQDDIEDWRRWHCLNAAAISLTGNGKLSGATLSGNPWPLPNVWLGVSMEQDRWCSRADILRQTPAAVRFISAEPLLEPLPSLSLTGIDWLIFGGESGNGDPTRRLVERCSMNALHRDGNGDLCTACHNGWEPKAWAVTEARRLLDLSKENGTAFWMKQWGGPRPDSGGHLLDGVSIQQFPGEISDE